MKKVLQHIFFIFITLAFITASGGVFFIRHHCKINNDTEIVFVKKEHGTCCAGETAEQGCCTKIQCECSTSPLSCIFDQAHHRFSCCTDSPVFLKLPWNYLPEDGHKIITQLIILPYPAFYEPAPVMQIFFNRLSSFRWPPGQFISIPILFSRLLL